MTGQTAYFLRRKHFRQLQSGPQGLKTAAMKIMTLRCNECGAPLDVPDAARYITCKHCNSQLSVQRTASTVFTEKLEQISAKTDAMAENLDIIRIQNDIALLDNEWAAEREQYLVSGKNGTKHEPGAGSVIGGIIAACFGVFWTIMASSMGAPSFFPLFGLVIIGLAVYGIFSGSEKAAKLKVRRAEYESRRAELQSELSRAR
jgi:DNA-directed RNA polymerase subunit RPC12/RpoP